MALTKIVELLLALFTRYRYTSASLILKVGLMDATKAGCVCQQENEPLNWGEGDGPTTR
jgi:hypothetical protein